MELLQQQLLGRDRGPALWGVELAEGGIEPIEGRIRQLSDPPERMTVRNQVLDQDVGEQRAGALLLTSHQAVDGCPIFAGVAGFFSELLKLTPHLHLQAVLNRQKVKRAEIGRAHV